MECSLGSFPGPTSASMLDELGRYVICTPQPFCVDLEACEGMWLATVDGQRLFDWCGYYGSKLLGHNHPALFEPEYLRKLSLAANNKVANPDFLTKECLEYYRTIYRIAPECMRNPKLEVYAINSGAEAVENMMKYLVSRFNSKNLRNGKVPTARRFVYFDKAFHGRTVYALNVTQTIDPVATKDFHGLTASGNIKCPFPSFDSDLSAQENRRRIDQSLQVMRMALEHWHQEVVGVIAEPLQGAGGQRVAMPEFFEELSAMCHKFDVALAFDEVQTGLGATGKMFAIDHYNLPHPPLSVATGKKFGNGVVYMHEPLEEVGVLDSTWGGTLADMVRFVRELEVVESEGLVEAAARNGQLLEDGLKHLRRKHSDIMSNVRGMGLYQGFTADTPQRKSAIIGRALEGYSTLLLGAGERSVRLRPNLHVTAADIEKLLEILDRVLADVSEY